MPTFTFTNTNAFDVDFYSITRSGTLRGEGSVTSRERTKAFVLDLPAGTELYFTTKLLADLSSDGTVVWHDRGITFDAYTDNGLNSQTHTVRDVSIQFSIRNHSASKVFLFTEISDSGNEVAAGSLSPNQFGGSWDAQGALKPSTIWRIKDAAGAIIKTYVTTAANYQEVEIPSGPLIPEVSPPTLIISDPIIIYSGPLANPDIKLTIPPERDTPYTLAGLRDSIFTSPSFSWDVFDFEQSIRKRTGFTDKYQIRAAVYTGLMAIARGTNRTPKEQAVMDWLAGQVKQTRIAAAQRALEEHDRWHRDPWRYEPPRGYDFPTYIIPTRQSPQWLFTTPNPPVLENQSLASFFAGLISNNGWSPINNPIILKGTNKKVQGIKSLEGVVGFPVFGAARAFEKLFNTDEGAGVFAKASARFFTQGIQHQMVDTTIDLAPIATAEAIFWEQTSALRIMSLQQFAPHSVTELKNVINELTRRTFGGAEAGALYEGFSDASLRSVVRAIVAGEFFARAVCTFVLTVALQAIINETVSLISKLNLRPELERYLNEKKSDPLPNLDNLLYYDKLNRVVLFTPDYQPTDPDELERFMGSQEVYRSFLLATV
jgi:hypothetical protein